MQLAMSRGVREHYFVHWTAISKRGFRSLLPGERVEFMAYRDLGGMRKRAYHVTGPGGIDVLGTPKPPDA